MDILKLITDQVNDKSTVSKFSKISGAESSKVEHLIKLAVPTLLQALNQNTNTKEGASSLSKALDKHKDDGIENTDQFLENVNPKEGSKMLDHIFSNKNSQVKSKLADQTGMNIKQVSLILALLAPLLISALGKQKKEKGLDESGVSSLVGNLLKKQDKPGIMQMLDLDKDGNVLDDVSKIVVGFLKK